MGTVSAGGMYSVTVATWSVWVISVVDFGAVFPHLPGQVAFCMQIRIEISNFVST